ncbi:TIGR00341 family protein [Psychrobacter sp. APC 3426]|uniref:TIGR00341 family protein n=1 Tax=Psychrobacter sp. APC 3426 TaxID=3035177 RepID=UPI0025B40029|nr:TIGR00341 family protein [Psychrobacter sp. APC 3426]MDN3397661.1 TIGR00341 family protein [Psychrobacter sp. APC 3426]
MTSSDQKTPSDALSENSDSLENSSSNETVTETSIADDMSVKGNESSEESDESLLDEETAGAQHPECKITMESVAPDVVATLETIDPDAPSEDGDLTSDSESAASTDLKSEIPREAETKDAKIQEEPSSNNDTSDSSEMSESSESSERNDVSEKASDTKNIQQTTQQEADAEVTVEADKIDSTNNDMKPKEAFASVAPTSLAEDSNDESGVKSSIIQQNIAGEKETATDKEHATSNDKDENRETIPAAKPNKVANESNTSSEDEQPTDEITDTNKDSDKPSKENSENQEDEVKKEKEAKLESYKQFAAEQFSNQKVDYPEVRVRIEANALPSKMYFIMNVLSAIIASYGLVTNSAAVVIGAMLVAMMLGPITGVALAIIDHRMPLLRKSLVTVLLGISLVLVVGFIVGWLHKDQPLTAEILSRTQPTSMDLMIALAGGTAGAYAMVSPHLSVAVVGVAVATALVPPLAASGILFANGELQLGFGALLLAITNIIAIQFTNALVLWVLGFRRLVKDDYKSNTYLTFLQRNAITLLLLGGLGTYLTINLQTNAKQQVFESSVKEAINSYFIDKGNVLTNTQFDTATENQVVRAVIRGETTPSSYDVRQIESIITKDMAENFPDYLPIKLQLRYLPVQVIESDPLIQDKLDKTDAAILTN